MPEWAPFTLSALLGITNGIFGAIPMIAAPANLVGVHKELAGNHLTRLNKMLLLLAFQELMIMLNYIII